MIEGLLRVVGSPGDVNALARGVGRVLVGRPSTVALIRLAGAVDAWEQQLRAAEPAAQDLELLARLRCLNRLLASACDAAVDHAGDRLDERILEALAEVGSARPGELADALGQSRPRVDSALQDLLRDGRVDSDGGTTALYSLAGTGG